MSHSYVSLLYHCVWSTEHRQRLITPQLQKRLWAYIGGIAKQNRMKALAIGGVDDHLHMLLSLPSTTTVSKAVQLIKGGSSKWVHDMFAEHHDFGWQEGYGAFEHRHCSGRAYDCLYRSPGRTPPPTFIPRRVHCHPGKTPHRIRSSVSLGMHTWSSQSSLRTPHGWLNAFPAMNRWAIVRRPSGTPCGWGDRFPSDKSLGYFRMSLRDTRPAS